MKAKELNGLTKIEKSILKKCKKDVSKKHVFKRFKKQEEYKRY